MAAKGSRFTPTFRQLLWKYKLPVVAGVAAVAAIPSGLSCIGFKPGGVEGGSLAAWIMSWSAKKHGGGVPRGGFVSIGQSKGEKGLSMTDMIIVGTCVTVTTVGVLRLRKCIKKRKRS